MFAIKMKLSLSVANSCVYIAGFELIQRDKLARDCNYQTCYHKVSCYNFVREPLSLYVFD